MASSKEQDSVVIFYQLSTKFVDNEREIPQKSEEVMYYSLAIGHHTGIIDCLSEKMRCSLAAYLEVIEALPEESDARYKLEGILRHGEIQIDKNHTALLLDSMHGLQSKNEGALSNEAAAWLKDFLESLETINSCPAVYLMGRGQRA